MQKLSPRIAGPLLALVLFGAYFALWRPARAWLARSVARPALAAVSAERARCFRVNWNERIVKVRRRAACPPSGDAKRIAPPSFRAPAGMWFLLPALILIGAFPYRRYWLWLFGAHLALGAVSLACAAAGLAWSDAGFAAHRFVWEYLVTAVSLGAPVLLLAGPRFPFSPSDEE